MTENKTLEHAIARLGLRVTTQYVEIIANRSLYTAKNKKYAVLLKDLWEHVLSCAHASHILANLLGLQHVDEVFTMALLHDICKLLIIQALAE